MCKLTEQLAKTINRAHERSADGLAPPQIVAALVYTIHDVVLQGCPTCGRDLVERAQDHLASIMKEIERDRAAGIRVAGQGCCIDTMSITRIAVDSIDVEHYLICAEVARAGNRATGNDQPRAGRRRGVHLCLAGFGETWRGGDSRNGPTCRNTRRDFGDAYMPFFHIGISPSRRAFRGGRRA
jgi:hypothetical protein